jgi:hypothetical protein
MTDQSKSEQQIDTSAQRVDGIDLPPLPEPQAKVFGAIP